MIIKPIRKDKIWLKIRNQVDKNIENKLNKNLNNRIWSIFSINQFLNDEIWHQLYFQVWLWNQL